MKRLRPFGLTPREHETLRVLWRTRSIASVAPALGLSAETVSKHLAAARRKLHVGSSMAAASKLAEHERQSTQSMGSNRFGIPFPDDFDDLADRRDGPASSGLTDLLRDVRGSVLVGPCEPQLLNKPGSERLVGTIRDRLPPVLVEIVLATAVLALIVGAVLAVGLVLNAVRPSLFGTINHLPI